jgi:hypothetical protein
MQKPTWLLPLLQNFCFLTLVDVFAAESFCREDFFNLTPDFKWRCQCSKYWRKVQARGEGPKILSVISIQPRNDECFSEAGGTMTQHERSLKRQCQPFRQSPRLGLGYASTILQALL